MKENKNNPESLEERLNNPDAKVKDDLIYSLQHRDFSIPKNYYEETPYLKYDLVGRLANSLKIDKSFGPNLYSTINKAELKRVYYGIACLGGKRIPEDLLNKLGPWEKICFCAGIWTYRKPIYFYSPSLPEIVWAYIKVGYDSLHKKHMINFHEGVYKRKLKIPGSQDYHLNLGEEEGEKGNIVQLPLFGKNGEEIPKDLEYLVALFEEEKTNPSPELSERISITLDSCSGEQLEYLTKMYGPEKLGGYALPAEITPLTSPP